MPKVVQLTPEQETWLATYGAIAPIGDVANALNCCRDTARRILTRRGIRFYKGEKFIPHRKSIEPPPPTWDRPCLNCGRRETRERVYFLCTTCRAAT